MSSSLLYSQLRTEIFSGAISSLLLLLCYYSYYSCFHITVVTSAFSGAAELTIQLLRLISILYLPLCRINKFGFYFPRRLLRSPILVGYQRRTILYNAGYCSLRGALSNQASSQNRICAPFLIEKVP